MPALSHPHPHQRTRPCPRAQEAKAELRASGLGGVQLGGNYVAGVALGKCIEYGYEFAAQVLAELDAQRAQQGSA